MKRAYRLRRPEHFQRVRREGRSYATALISLTVAASRHRTARCGFVVGKRIGKAVERNRAKRRVREATRLVYQHIPWCWDLVFTVRSPEVALVPFSRIQADIEHLLRRAGLWRPSAEAAAST